MVGGRDLGMFEAGDDNFAAFALVLVVDPKI